MDFAVNWVIAAMILIVVAAVSGFMVMDYSDEPAKKSNEQSDKGKCDYWRARSTTAGNTSVDDKWEKKFDSNNCASQRLDSLVDGPKDFYDGVYDPEAHEK